MEQALVVRVLVQCPLPHHSRRLRVPLAALQLIGQGEGIRRLFPLPDDGFLQQWNVLPMAVQLGEGEMEAGPRIRPGLRSR
jgi:hypothetical protein